MKKIKILVYMMIVMSCIGFVACTNQNIENNIKNCTFTLINNDKEYEISQEYKLFSKGPTGDIVIPNIYKDLKVTQIGSFACCHEITSVKGNINTTKIISRAFSCTCQESMRQGKMKLSKIEFDKEANLKEIGKEAFFKCSKLETIYLPSKLESFGDGVFYGCIRLTDIYLFNSTPPSGALKLFTSGSYGHKPNESLTIYVPSEFLETYKNSEWNMYNIQPIIAENI